MYVLARARYKLGGNSLMRFESSFKVALRKSRNENSAIFIRKVRTRPVPSIHTWTIYTRVGLKTLSRWFTFESLSLFLNINTYTKVSIYLIVLNEIEQRRRPWIEHFGVFNDFIAEGWIQTLYIHNYPSNEDFQIHLLQRTSLFLELESV